MDKRWTAQNLPGDLTLPETGAIFHESAPPIITIRLAEKSVYVWV
jgi:hypothetical protein